MSFSRSALTRAAAVAALTVATSTSALKAEEAKSALSVSAGVDFASAFISYGADVWGTGADDFAPFNARSSIFAYATVTAAVSDELSLSLNVWGDLNNNTESSIANYVQEIDVNLGAAYKMDKFTFSATFGQWMYANEVEGIIDLGVSFDDTGTLIEDFAFSPYALIHYRYLGVGAQDDSSGALVLGIRPTWTLNADSTYPITVAVPASVALFSDEFQGGDGGLGYVTVGVSATVPLAFIPAEYGSWTASANLSYWYTPEDAIPGNPDESFLTSTVSINVGF